MAYNFLEQHARDNVWCVPNQDKQYIIEAARLSPINGDWNNTRIMWRSYPLPKPGVRFHVFMVGQIHPLFLGLFPQQYQWISFTDAMNKQKLIADLYLDDGVQLPRFQAWYMVDPDRNVVMAIQDPRPTIEADLGQVPVYLRTYSNAYFDGLRDDTTQKLVVTNGIRPTNANDILAFQQEYDKYVAMPGQTYAFVNGFQVSTIDPFTVQLGDLVEYVYDQSIYRVVDFTISDLRTFDSLLDLKTKYLLHYEGVTDVIDYNDDLDFYLINKTTGTQFAAVYIHRNAGDTVRNVTHKDYSITVPYLVQLANDLQWNQNYNNLVIRMFVRYGGALRPLIFEANRIKELYKMADFDIRQAFLGIDSTVSVWRADNLENSAYTAIMRNPKPCIPETMIDAGYGYSGVTKVIGDTPAFSYLSSNQPVVDVPYVLQSQSQAYEYDANGLLMGSYTHFGPASKYPLSNVTGKMVEMISGIGDIELDEVYGQASTTLVAGVDYRFYTCPIINGVPNNKWQDVTGTNVYGIVNNVLTWIIDPTLTYTLVRGNRKFLSYELDLSMTEGVLDFSLTHLQRRGSVISQWVMQIPMGEESLWLNNHPLVRNVDYFVNFPRINIVNKEFLIDPLNQPQKVYIRATGFCNPDFTPADVQTDTGFVQDGLLSANGVFNLRDDKVLNIIVGGALKDRSQLKFAETDAADPSSNPINGQPYSVKQIVVPTRGMTASDTYTLRAISLATDKSVSDYLTIKLPQTPIPSPAPIVKYWQTFSPFCSKLIYDLNQGILDDPRMYQQYSDQVVRELCQPYEYLLAMDPTQQNLRPDPRFVIIHPHNLFTVIDIGIYQYKFLKMAIRIYLNDIVDTANFLRVKDYQGGT